MAEPIDENINNQTPVETSHTIVLNESEEGCSENERDKEEERQVEEVEKMVEELGLDEGEENEDDEGDASEEEVKSAKSSEKEHFDTKEFIEISKQNVVFGKTPLFPGSIEEVDLSITLKDDAIDSELTEPYSLRVIAKCGNKEFDALDEYVYSVRSNERYEYFEEVRFRIKKKERANLKVAVKIPPVKENYVLTGFLEIQLQELNPVLIPISAACQFPQIICMKDLYKTDEDCSMIKVPAKKNMMRLPPIPFKNLSSFNFGLEIEAISNESFSNKPYDIFCQSLVNCQASMQFFVNIQLKENINYKGPVPVRDTIRKILLLKIKNSSVYFNFPLEVNVYEGTVGGMN